MPWLVSGASNSGKYSRPLPSLWPKAAETARSTPLANRRPALARVVRVPSIPTSTVTTPPSIDAPVLVITLTTAKKALSPYWEEAGPRMISTRSNVDGSSPNSAPISACPNTLSLTRWPLINSRIRLL